MFVIVRIVIIASCINEINYLKFCTRPFLINAFTFLN